MGEKRFENDKKLLEHVRIIKTVVTENNNDTQNLSNSEGNVWNQMGILSNIVTY